MIEFELSRVVLVGFMGLGTPELLIVAAVFLLLFGSTKLPALMRNMGRSVNEFKQGIKEKPVDANIEHERVSEKERETKNEDEPTSVS